MSILIGDDEFLFAVRAGLLSFLNFPKSIPTFLREKIFLIDQVDAVFFGKLFRAFAGQQKWADLWRFQCMLRFIHN